MNTTSSKSSQAEQQTHESLTSFKWLIILLTVVAACLLSMYFMNFNDGWGNQGDFGAFGDFLGGVLNPILGFATVGLLIWSLKMQMEELSLSRKELTLTRQELAETKEETALSRKAMEEQVSHLQKEAKLNELIRLMVDLRTQFQSQINIPLLINDKLYSLLLSIAPSGSQKNESIRRVSVYNILYESSSWNIQKSTAIKTYIGNDFDSSTNISSAADWQEIENTLIHFSNIALKFHELSNSPELTNIYLDEARKMLQPFQNVFTTEAIATELKRINGILYPVKQAELVD
jgi:NADH:ubiquinone oxidoreductase subunit C